MIFKKDFILIFMIDILNYFVDYRKNINYFEIFYKYVKF